MCLLFVYFCLLEEPVEIVGLWKLYFEIIVCIILWDYSHRINPGGGEAIERFGEGSFGRRGLAPTSGEKLFSE